MAAGRPRKIETCDTVEAAMGAFWRSGYKGTSLADLECATGLTKGSLYKAFDDKHDLFIQALEMYLGKVRETLFAEWDQPGPAMEKLSRWADLATTACAKGGCLAIKTSDELAAEDGSVKKILVEHWEALGSRLQGIVVEGQGEGSIRSDFTADKIVRILIRLAMGTAVAAPLTSPERNVEAFKSTLDLLKA